MTEERRKKRNNEYMRRYLKDPQNRARHRAACAWYYKQNKERLIEYHGEWYRERSANPRHSQKWIADRRIALGLSQAELARLCSVSQSTICKIERGILSIERAAARKRLYEVLGRYDG